jgi:hypothetical protein
MSAQESGLGEPSGSFLNQMVRVLLIARIWCSASAIISGTPLAGPQESRRDTACPPPSLPSYRHPSGELLRVLPWSLTIILTC